MKKTILAAVMVLAGGTAFAQMDATEVGPTMKQEAKDIGHSAKHNAKELGKQAGLATADQGTFKANKAFKVDGDLKKAGSEEITIARQGLPDAVLDVRDQTKVFIDGKQAKAADLKDGMKVDGKFQLEGEETVAVELRAKSNKRAMGGSGNAGDEVKAKSDDAKQDMDRAADKAENKADDAKDDAQQDLNDATH